MRMRDVCRFATALAAALCLLSCDGGGGEGGSFADSGGISGTGLSEGAIDSFGSIFVNDVEWDLARATIEIDGAFFA